MRRSRRVRTIERSDVARSSRVAVPRVAAGRRSSRRAELLPALALLLSGGASESRLWRITPFSATSGDERVNGFPILYTDGSATAVLWPLIDFDRDGFAVRPLVSKDESEWDVVWPLSHWDTRTGDGWALTAYSCGESRGLFPLFHVGPEFHYLGPAWWNERDGEVQSSGLFPIAWWDAEHADGLLLNAYSWQGNRGLFPLCNFGPSLDWIGPAWWKSEGDAVTDWGVLPLGYRDRESGDGYLLNAYSFGESRGLFPLFHLGPEFNFVGPAWWHERDDAVDGCGLFPLAWATTGDDRSSLALLPLWYQRQEPDHELRAALLPPTWWETAGETQRHFVLPFYAHLADADASFKLVAPLFAAREDAHGSSWWTPLANGWQHGAESGFNLYPLWWSSQSESPAAPGSEPSSLAQSESSRMLLPLFLDRRHGHERLLLTPLGGRGWDESGATTFTNLLGPLFHHSRGPDSETTALLWPLFQQESRGETTQMRAFPLLDVTVDPAGHDAFALAGLVRHVAEGESRSLRLWPLWSDVDLAEADGASPDLLFDLTLAGRRNAAAQWSNHLFPLWHASGDKEQSEVTALAGLARVATTDEGHAWRLFPLASASTDEAADGWLDDWTLARYEQREQPAGDGAAPEVSTSARLFPLFDTCSSQNGSATRAALGLARVATTERGHAWRLLPLASASTDAAADGWLDDWTLARYEQRDSGDAWRLWPLVSSTASEAPRGPFDLLTLVGVDRDSTESSLHVGTPLVFDLDRRNDGSGWDARVLSLLHFGSEEQAAAPATPGIVERRYAGFLFDWFKAEQRVVADLGGATREESHYRVPFLHEYEREGEKTEWDALCYAVRSVDTPEQSHFSVLGYAYRSVRTGDSTQRDIFPFITCDDAPDKKRVSFLWRLFEYERQGDQVGGHVLFIPWGDAL